MRSYWFSSCVVLLMIFVVPSMAQADSCSCTAPDGSCSASISCASGCTALCGNGGACTTQCLGSESATLTGEPESGEKETEATEPEDAEEQPSWLGRLIERLLGFLAVPVLVFSVLVGAVLGPQQPKEGSSRELWKVLLAGIGKVVLGLSVVIAIFMAGLQWHQYNVEDPPSTTLEIPPGTPCNGELSVPPGKVRIVKAIRLYIAVPKIFHVDDSYHADLILRSHGHPPKRFDAVRAGSHDDYLELYEFQVTEVVADYLKIFWSCL